MNSAVILNILVQVSTSKSHICDNDTNKNEKILNVSDDNPITTDYTCFNMCEKNIEPLTNPDTNEDDICVDVFNCKTKEIYLTKKLNKKTNKCLIVANEENNLGCFSTHKINNTDDKEFHSNIYTEDNLSPSSSVSRIEYLNKSIQECDSDEKIAAKTINCETNTQACIEIPSQNDFKTCDNKL